MRNNLRRPAVDQTVEKFKHKHKASIEVMVEHNVSDPGSKSDHSLPDEAMCTVMVIR